MSTAGTAQQATFEEALEKLESIVESMESGELPLEELLARYEEGTRLVKSCQERLATAELRIRELEPRSPVCPPEMSPADDSPAK